MEISISVQVGWLKRSGDWQQHMKLIILDCEKKITSRKSSAIIRLQGNSFVCIANNSLNFKLRKLTYFLKAPLWAKQKGVTLKITTGRLKFSLQTIFLKTQLTIAALNQATDKRINFIRKFCVFCMRNVLLENVLKLYTYSILYLKINSKVSFRRKSRNNCQQCQ